MAFTEREPVLLDDSFVSLDEFAEHYTRGGLLVPEKQHGPEHMDAVVDLSLVDLSQETALNMALINIYDEETQDNIEKEGDPLTNRVTLAFIPEMGELFIIDGFHRIATLQRHGFTTASATIIETTLEDAYDRRIRAQAHHGKLKVSRLTTWIDEAWQVSGPCADKISAETAFGFADERSGFSQRRHGITDEELVALKEWVAEKMQAWSISELTTGYIHDILHYRDVVDQEIIALVRDDESLSQLFLKGLAADLPNKPEHQKKACQFKLLYGTSNKQFRKLCKALAHLSVDQLEDVEYSSLVQKRSLYSDPKRRRKGDDLFGQDPLIFADLQGAVARLRYEADSTSTELPRSPTPEQVDAFVENYRQLGLLMAELQVTANDMQFWATRLHIDLPNEQTPGDTPSTTEERVFMPKSIPELLREQVVGYEGLSDSDKQLLLGMATNDQTLANGFPMSRLNDVTNSLHRLKQSTLWLLCKENTGEFIRTLRQRDMARRSGW